MAIPPKPPTSKRQLSFADLLKEEGLHQVPPPAMAASGSLDIQTELMEVLANAIKACPKDRHAIAADMSRLSGMDVTKTMLDAWTAPSKEGHRFPLALLPAFEAACQTTSLLELLARKRGATILMGKQVILAQLGRINQMEEELKAERLRLKRQL